MKKKLLITLALVLILVGCGKKKGNSASDIVKALNSEEITSVINNKNIEVVSGPIKVASSKEYFVAMKESLESENLDKPSETDKKFIENYSTYLDYMIEHVKEDDENPVEISFLGATDETGAYGILVYVFNEDVNLDAHIIEEINKYEYNEFEYIYVHKNVVVTSDYGFVSDYSYFLTTVDQIVSEFFSE